MEELIVHEAARLDHIVTGLPGVGSRSRARRVLDSGKVTVDGAEVSLADASRILEPGTVVVLQMDRPGTARPQARARRELRRTDLAILYEDDVLIAIDKPAGMLSDTATHAQRSRGSARAAVHRYLRPQAVPALVVHRIDRDTSGVILFAKTAAARDHVKEQLAARTPRRVYWAAVRGRPDPSEGSWTDWIRWDSGRNLQVPCEPHAAGGVLAETHYRTLVATPRASVLEVRLVTGRRNQIRLQAGLRGHPLLGERQYDLAEDPPAVPSALRMARQALHAWRLTITHPTTDRPITFEAPLPPDLERLNHTLRGRAPRSGRSR